MSDRTRTIPSESRNPRVIPRPTLRLFESGLPRPCTIVRPAPAQAAPSTVADGKPTTDVAADCKHYRGDKPCSHNRLCNGCSHYEATLGRVCVVKIGALGDVIRTLSILPALAERFPKGQITWVTSAAACRMLVGHPLIHRLIAFEPLAVAPLAHELFDTVISLDKEPEPCALAMSLRARQKMGVGLSEHGKPVPLNPEARHYFNLGLSDELKFQHNAASYPALVHEALALPYKGAPYELHLAAEQAAWAREHLASLGWTPDAPTLGVNVGAGKAFANKMWPADRIAQVIAALRAARSELQVVLLGGPSERPIIDAIVGTKPSRRTKRQPIFDAGTDHTEQRFAALVGACDTLFTGDTMAMHVAIALKRGVVAYLGPTCEQEIDLFGLGEKLVARVACAPCYKRVCDKGDVCTTAISTDDAVAAIGRVLDARTQSPARPAATNDRRPKLTLPIIHRRKAG